MALSLSEQLQIIDGEINPSQKALIDIVRQSVISKANEFQSSHKITSEVSNFNAHNYVLKMKAAINRLYKNDFSLIELITRATVSILGKDAITAEELLLYSENDYLALIDSKVYKAMEQIATVCHEEIDDYNAI